jgi:GTP:adenosylcobinamide-phosphate guanylyltransferase
MRFAALVLAGRRGAEDPLARSRGATHRATLDVGGIPMLLRVVRALRAAPGIDGITVSIDDTRALDEVPELKAALAAGDLRVHRSLDSPSRSVSDALAGCAPDEALLVTTADHALLDPEIVEHFIAAAARSEADLLVGVVSRSSLDARYPETTRTYLRMRGEAWTGANLFCFRMRRLDLDAALERASRSIGARIRAVPLPFPEAAIDVDRATDLALVERILAERERCASGA